MFRFQQLKNSILSGLGFAFLYFGKWALFNNSEKLITDDFNHKWLAYLNAADAAGIPPVTNPEILKSLKQVFAFSDFVAAGCTRDPAMPVDLINSGDITRRYPEDEYHLKLLAVFSKYFISLTPYYLLI